MEIKYYVNVIVLLVQVVTFHQESCFGIELIYFSGTVLSSLPMGSKLECVAKCMADSQCEIATYDNGLCKQVDQAGVQLGGAGQYLGYVNPQLLCKLRKD